MASTQFLYQHIAAGINIFHGAGLSGIYPPWFEKKSKWYRDLWRVYSAVTDAAVHVTFLWNAIGLFTLPDALHVLMNVTSLSHSGQMMAKIIVLRSNKDAIQVILRDMNDSLLESLDNPIDSSADLYRMNRSQLRKNDMWVRAVTVMLVLLTVCFFTPGCVRSFTRPEDAGIIIHGWYPYDPTVPENKQISNLVQIFIWSLTSFKMAALDSVIQSLVVLHAFQFKHMHYLMERIVQESGRGEEDVNRKLRWWTGQHQRILRVSLKLRRFLSPLFFFTNLECLLNMCVGPFTATASEESPWTLLEVLVAIGVFGVVFLQMFVMCRLGDYNQKEVTEASEPGYSSAVFDFSEGLKKNILMILLGMKLDVKFSAIGLFNVNSMYFARLAQGIFSYFMALRQFS